MPEEYARLSGASEHSYPRASSLQISIVPQDNHPAHWINLLNLYSNFEERERER